MSKVVFDTYLQKAIYWGFLFTFLTTPLLWTQANSELFELPKMMFVYFSSIVLGGLWIIRMFVNKKILYRRTLFDLPLLFFLISQFLSTIFSIHPYTSIFGYYTRFHGGLLSTLSYIVLYVVFVSNVNKKQAIASAITLFASGGIVSLIALPEHFGVALSCFAIRADQSISLWEKLQADCWVQDIVSRVFGTFGQPNWLAAYILTTAPIGWALLPTSKKEFSNSKRASYALIASIIIVSLVVLWYTKSRSGLLGLGFTGLVLGLSTSLLRHKKKVSLLLSTLLLLSAGGFGYFLVQPENVINTITPLRSYFSDSVRPDPVLDTLSQGGTSSFAIRQIVWKGAWNIFVHNPILGTGTETFAYSYYTHRPLEHNVVSEWDFLYNKAHNELLNYLANNGLLGLVSYSLLHVTFVILIGFLFIKNTKSKDSLPVKLAFGLLAGQVGLLITNIMGFSTVSVTVVMYASWAIVAVLYHQQSTQPSKKSSDAPISLLSYIGITGVLVVMSVLLFNLSRYYYADTVYAAGRSAESQNDLAEAIDKYQQAILISPRQAQYYDDYSDSLSKATLTFAQQQKEDVMQKYAQQTLLSSVKTLELNPVHVNFHKSQAGVFIRMSALDPEFLNVAEEILVRATQLAPTDAKVVYNLGLIKQDQEATNEAKTYFEQAVDMKSNYESARLELAKIYESQNELDKALEQYQYIVNYIAPRNSQAKSGIERIQSETEE